MMTVGLYPENGREWRKSSPWENEIRLSFPQTLGKKNVYPSRALTLNRIFYLWESRRRLVCCNYSHTIACNSPSCAHSWARDLKCASPGNIPDSARLNGGGAGVIAANGENEYSTSCDLELSCPHIQKFLRWLTKSMSLVAAFEPGWKAPRLAPRWRNTRVNTRVRAGRGLGLGGGCNTSVPRWR